MCKEDYTRGLFYQLWISFKMSEQNTEPTTNDGENNYSTPANDLKNMQEVTQYVSINCQVLIISLILKLFLFIGIRVSCYFLLAESIF